MQFFKTHSTNTTDAIKDPRRKISIEECLYFASIVHLLWQTSKSKISALSSGVPRDVVIKQDLGASFPLREKQAAIMPAPKQHNNRNKKEVEALCLFKTFTCSNDGKTRQKLLVSLDF